MVKTEDSISWLMKSPDPGIRYVTLRDLIGVSANDPKLTKARQDVYATGHIGKILKEMKPEGYWVRPGGGYNPKYTSAVWSLILLSQLGAHIKDDERVMKACTYYLDHAYSPHDSISYNGTPSGTIDCLQGNMCAALTTLGYEDERLDKTCDWISRSVIGDNVQYFAYKCGPGFLCGANGKKPCAWGATKILLALGKIPENKRTLAMKKAIQVGVDFFLKNDLIKADFPTRSGTKPNRDWWLFGFPVFYITDLLQVAEALVSVGYGHDPRLKSTIDYIVRKQDSEGRWMLEYDYAGKTWGDYGEKNQPNEWVTYRALKVLKALSKN
jgi:hypothetical protein